MTQPLFKHLSSGRNGLGIEHSLGFCIIMGFVGNNKIAQPYTVTVIDSHLVPNYFKEKDLKASETGGGSQLCSNHALHIQSLYAEDIPAPQCAALQGRTAGDSCYSLGHVNPNLCLEGDQFCLLRPWESSRTRLSLRRSQWRGTAPSPLFHANGETSKNQ